MAGDHLWEAIGAIGQVLGSLAVFITLGYLAVQVRRSRSEMQRATSQGRAEAARELMLNRANNERLMALEVRARTAIGARPSAFALELIERAGMTEEEALAVTFEEYAWWQYRTLVIPHINELTDGERKEFAQQVRGVYGGVSVARLWYQHNKTSLNPEAVHYIDDLLASSDTRDAREPLPRRAAKAAAGAATSSQENG